MHCRLITTCLCMLLLILAARVDAQSTVSSLHPASIKPGETTALTLLGTDLKDNVRVVVSNPAVAVQVRKVEPQQAVVDFAVPPEMQLGPLGIWIATQSGPQSQQVIFIDDLPAIADNEANHSRESAQVVSTLNAIDGKSDGAQSDFYRFSVAAGQRVAFEVHTQSIRSTMDPMVRLLDSQNKTLKLVDDDATGPECRFSHLFGDAGDYWLEIRDSRYLAGGAYHLRLGDFPVVTSPYPLVARRGEKTSLTFLGLDGDAIPRQDVFVPESAAKTMHTVSVKLPQGQSSAWVSLLAKDYPQVSEPELQPKPDASAVAPLAFPIGISGSFDAPLQRDSFAIQGVKGQSVRVAARTRSLGCETLLRMELFNANHEKVAETKVTDADEWSFDYAFLDDGVYSLEVTDLLQRGGASFGYWIEVIPGGVFSVAFKPVTETREAFAIEPGHGVATLDLTVERFGYDGEIELSLRGETVGLRLLDARIPAGSKEVRVYLLATEAWTPESIATVRFDAKAVANPAIACVATSQSLHRVKEPHVLFPNDWNDGVAWLSGVLPLDPYFSISPAAPIQLARPLRENSISLNLARTNAEFKAPVTLMGNALPPGWTLSTVAENDVYKTRLVRAPECVTEPEILAIQVVADFNNRTRLETVQLPVQWFDPLKITAKTVNPVVAGGDAVLSLSIVRDGNDPQPISLKIVSLPPGIAGPGEAITVPADQSTVQISLRTSANAVSSEPVSVQWEAVSKFRGSDFSLSFKSEPMFVAASPKVVEVFPNSLVLNDARSRQQLVVTGFDDAGNARDWTRDAVISSKNPELLRVEGSVAYPVANGDTEILVSVGGVSHAVPAQIRSLEVPRATAFESEVLVAISKQGCNSGACHGSPSGKGSFRMSLRAFDMKLDQLTLIREDFGRRINTIEPDQSLLLTKPLMKVAHGGGKQVHETDAAYAVLRNWIAEGAKADPVDTPRCVRLEIFPNQKRVLKRVGGGQQLAAIAHFANGTSRDVTHLAAYESSNTSVATIDKQGLITAHGRGEAAILVRFLEHIESLPLMFIEDVPNFQWAAPTPNNYIDELVNSKLQQLQFLPSQTCSDSDFLRRVYLDVIGTLPTVQEANDFIAETSADKRSRLIDRLLERNEYAKFWAMKWGDLLKMTSKLLGDEGVYKYHRWVEESFRTNMPYDEFARQLLISTGSTYSNPPANFYRTSTDMNECVETISQVFLGARLQCAKCHNHPFERWTQDNYYGLGAFFQRVERRKTQRPGEMFIWTATSGEVTQPRTGHQMKPWLPQVGSLDNADSQDRRIAFASWLVNSKNPYFAKIEVNRIWSQLFTRGIVDPIDDFRDSNPPSNEGLLNALAEDFAEHRFDRKHILRTILNSRTYQASYQANAFNEKDLIYFSHQLPRFLGAEQLLDAINQATGLSQVFGGLPAGTKATQLPAPDIVKVEFLKVFGQPERSTVCACERAEDSNLGMAIELFNGALVHDKLRDPANRFRKAIAEGRSAEDVIREVYLASVCREPTEAELQASLAHCKSRDDIASGIEDVCWALLNTDEFLFQH